MPAVPRADAASTGNAARDAPLRVCYLTHPPALYSGAVFHAFWLAEKLAPHGIHVEFLAFARKPRPARTRQDGFDVHYLPPAPGWLGRYRELSLWPRLARFLRRHPFDLVHVHSCGYTEAFAAAAARLSETASVANVMQQGSDLAWSGRLETPIHRRLLRMFDRIVPISDETYEEAGGVGLPASRLTKIPIGVDVDRFRPASPERRRRARTRWGLPSDAPIVSYVGAFSDRKNIVWLLDAWLEGQGAGRDAHLLVVGDAANDPEGEEVRRRVQARVDSAGDRIRWIPFVSEIEHIYAASDLFVLPSHREGMPSVVLQAMASGLPVLATPVAGVPELLGVRGERGWIFGFDDRRGFRAGLETLLDDAALRRSIGRAARDHVAEHCALDRVAEAYLGLYREVARTG